MNGVRRFLAGGSSSATTTSQLQASPPPPDSTPLPQFDTKQSPNWPPQQSPLSSPVSSPKTTTAALFLRKDRQRPSVPRKSVDEGSNGSSSHSRTSVDQPPPPNHSRGFSSSTREYESSAFSMPNMASSSRSTQSARLGSAGSSGKRSSNIGGIRDELLISLLASEAVVDCRDFEILNSEEVEELKREHTSLSSRRQALERKVGLETKMRDAAISLAKVRASKEAEAKLQEANRRVDAAQQELWRFSERSSFVHKRLMEHRAGVLSLSVRNMESKISSNSGAGHDSGYNTPTNPLSPVSSSITGFSNSSASTPRFDGAHLFAGHADTIVPRRNRSAESLAGEVTALETKLKAATDALSVAGRKQAETARELSLMRLEKDEVETMLGMELQTANDMVQALESDLPRYERLESDVQALQQEKQAWNDERAELMQRLQHLEQNQTMPGESDDIARLKGEWENERSSWEQERYRLQEEVGSEANVLQSDLEGLQDSLQSLMDAHEIPLMSRDTSSEGLLASIDSFLARMRKIVDSHSEAEGEWASTRQKLEADVRAGLDKRETMAREIEDARREREEARREARELEVRVRSPEVSQSPLPLPEDLPTDVAEMLQVLLPLWNTLPSPEARAAKFQSVSRTRINSPTMSSPASPIAVPGKSLAELDVRSLKTLYNGQTNGNQTSKQAFSIEAFAIRVKALITDDRALIERLVRFAQAHDLLKKNAERAQRLAHESSTALETYKKQVLTLEDTNMSASSRFHALQDEIRDLQSTIERLTVEKQAAEDQAAQQTATCQQLTQINNALSAKTLALAEEATSAPERIKRQLEKQLAETKAALDDAQAELDAMRMSEQTQKIALLDEMNSLQADNGQLREQLRALKR